MPLARLLAAALLVLTALPARAQRVADWKEALEKGSASAAAPLAPLKLGDPVLPTVAGAKPGPSGNGASASPGTPAAAPAPGAPAKPEERAILEKLTTENQMVREEVAKRLKDLIVEKEELRIRSEVNAERQKAELAKLEAEYQRLSLENRLNEERNKKSLEDLAAVQKRLAAENQVDEEKHKKELADIRQAREKLQQENDVLREKLRTEEMKTNSEKLALDLEGQRMASEGARLRLERDKLEEKVTRLRIDIDERTKKEDWKSEANKDPLVVKEPFSNGVLTVSDRRITLNGPIFRAAADRVTERIAFFNNVSDDPIFIIIDSSPGGSVMEGYRIIKAMQTSKAPVHVVVKSFAASMAALITTSAPKSYVYRNAIILHHQPWGLTIGNLTQQKEYLEKMKEWWRRLNEPVAAKMGITLEQMVKKMYEKNSDGDWEEFGDEAVKIKWASTVVEEVRETGIVKKPDDKAPLTAGMFGLEEKVDGDGNPYVKLPRLEPYNFYWIHNPDRYYR